MSVSDTAFSCIVTRLYIDAGYPIRNLEIVNVIEMNVVGCLTVGNLAK